MDHSIIVVNISVVLLVFVITPDLSESVDFQSSVDFEDWKLSNDLDDEIDHGIVHEKVLDVPDHGPFLLSFLFLLGLLLFEIGCIGFLQFSNLRNFVLL